MPNSMQLIEALELPVLLTWLAHDLLPDDYPLLVGRPGPLAPAGPTLPCRIPTISSRSARGWTLVITGYAPIALRVRRER